MEIVIKIQIGRLPLSVAPEEIARTAVERGFIELPVVDRILAKYSDLVEVGS